MSDEEEKKEGFVKVTWKEIVAGVISLLILGAVTFVFSNFSGRLETLESQYAVHEEALKIELINAIGDLTEELEDTTDDLTTFGNNQRSLERTVIRLEAILERMENGQ